uniref:Protein FRA10AC1 n=1 Tax=Lygus hesperus TaxID=30085 RepID=A0A0A9X435_LYGHE
MNFQFAMRWQTEQELVVGKGQFICGSKHCAKDEGLRTWEVNFAYKEQGEKKNALVKLRLCDKCSAKLNHRHKKKEIKRLGKSNVSASHKSSSTSDITSTSPTNESSVDTHEDGKTPEPEPEEMDIWRKPVEVEEPSREDEFEKYLEHLLL